MSVAAGATHCVVVNDQGQALVWGRGDSGQVRLYLYLVYLYCKVGWHNPLTTYQASLSR